MDNDAQIPIGRPMPGYDVYLVNHENQPVPVGWPGQIAVAGPAVSVGYLGNDVLSRARFVPSPVSTNYSAARSRMYLTGDMGRMLADGSVVHLGRMEGDSQVKLRGIRIELTDIANTILEQADGVLANAAVGSRGGEGQDQFLVAYVVFATGKVPRDSAGYLAKLVVDLPLPVYMRPSHVLKMVELPMNASGKLDRKKLATLPLPLVQETRRSDTGEMSPAEAKLKQIWKRVLRQTTVEIDN